MIVILGIRDLASHLLFLAKENGIKEEELYITGFEKLIFVAFLFCLRADVKIRYDVLFYKTVYGATSDEVKDYTSESLDRRVSFKRAKEIEGIADDLNNKFINMLREESNELLYFVKYIVSSNVYQEIEFFNNLTEEDNATYDMRVLRRDENVVWDIEEICQLAEINDTSEIDLRVPLTQDEYESIERYLKIRDMRFINEEAEGLFRYKDIQELRNIPSDIIESIEINGAYMV